MRVFLKMGDFGQISLEQLTYTHRRTLLHTHTQTERERDTHTNTHTHTHTHTSENCPTGNTGLCYHEKMSHGLPRCAPSRPHALCKGRVGGTNAGLLNCQCPPLLRALLAQDQTLCCPCGVLQPLLRPCY